MPGLTLRQVEVIRAVMMTGSIAGAAEYLNVSAPGISRLVKHAEESLRVRLFERKGGVFLPAPEARAVFDQINEVYGKIEGLETAIGNLNSGKSGALAFGSVPVGGAVHRGAGGRGDPPALSRPLHRPQRAEDRGGGGLSPAGAGRAGGDELRLRASLARVHRARRRRAGGGGAGRPCAGRAGAGVGARAGGGAADRGRPVRPLWRDHRRALRARRRRLPPRRSAPASPRRW